MKAAARKIWIGFAVASYLAGATHAQNAKPVGTALGFIACSPAE
jgi:hypothetical protein